MIEFDGQDLISEMEKAILSDEIIEPKTEQTVLNRLASLACRFSNGSEKKQLIHDSCLDMAKRLNTLELEQIKRFFSFIDRAGLCSSQVLKNISKSVRYISRSESKKRGTIFYFLSSNSVPITAAEALSDTLKNEDPWLWFDLAGAINSDLAYQELKNILKGPNDYGSLFIRLPSLWKNRNINFVRRKDFFEDLLGMVDDKQVKNLIISFAKNLGGFDITYEQLKTKKNIADILGRTNFTYKVGETFSRA